MKLLRGALILVAIFAALSFMYGLSFANGENTQADIKLLRDAAAALQQSRPDLALQLNHYADREARELGAMTNEKTEKEEVGEKVEPKEEQAEVEKAKSEQVQTEEKVEPSSGQGEGVKY